MNKTYRIDLGNTTVNLATSTQIANSIYDKTSEVILRELSVKPTSETIKSMSSNIVSSTLYYINKFITTLRYEVGEVYKDMDEDYIETYYVNSKDWFDNEFGDSYELNTTEECSVNIYSNISYELYSTYHEILNSLDEDNQETLISAIDKWLESLSSDEIESELITISKAMDEVLS